MQALSNYFRAHAGTSLFAAAGALYLLGVWFHIPYGGGHIYSDIVTVFQNRLDNGYFTVKNLPLIDSFVEYPPITSYFMYFMGALAKYVPVSLPPDLMGDYYRYTSVFLVIPTFLLISELFKICDILGIRHRHRRTLLYYVATPSFIFMLLLNWYIIGVFFAIFGLRKFLQGSRWASGILLGLSAASNLVTAVPALGMFFFDGGGLKSRARFLAGIGIAVLAVYLPLVAINSFPHNYLDSNGVLVHFPFAFGNTSFITAFISYEQNWYIEGSWMLAFFNNLDPIRHVMLPVLFVSLSLLILSKWYRIDFVNNTSVGQQGGKRHGFLRSRIFPFQISLRKQIRTQRERANVIVTSSWFFTFAFLFSTYVFTPQMNLILLPFFVIAPITKRYWEFLAFDIVNALVIVYGFSQPLLAFGISVPFPVQFGPVYMSPVQALAVIRSFWVGKFLLYDGLIKMRRFPEKELISEAPLPSSPAAP